MKLSIRRLSHCAVIAALYAAAVMLLAPLSYTVLQFRAAEALCVLPFFVPYTMWGLFAGCAISNLISGAGIPDVIFGSLATLLAGFITARLGMTAGKRPQLNRFLALLSPVIVNGLVVGGILTAASSPENVQSFLIRFLMFSLQLAVEEAAVMFAFGLPLMMWFEKSSFFKKFIDRADK